MASDALSEHQVEAAARAFCRALGADENEIVGGPDPTHPTMLSYQPLWKWQVGKIRQHAALDEAIAAGRASPARMEGRDG